MNDQQSRMPQDLVLITGATGHLGFRTLVGLLQHGYRARIAHRRPEQGDVIKSQKSVKPFQDSDEFVQVPGHHSARRLRHGPSEVRTK